MITLDAKSLLVEAKGDQPLGDLEREAGEHGYTLGVDVGAHAETTLAEWLGKGAPGAASAFADPADHLVAGLEATLANGKKLEVRPGPRRAVGPDLVALLVGTRGHLGHIDRVWLRVHRRDARRHVLPLPSGYDLDPPVSLQEAALMEAIARALADDRP